MEFGKRDTAKGDSKGKHATLPVVELHDEKLREDYMFRYNILTEKTECKKIG